MKRVTVIDYSLYSPLLRCGDANHNGLNEIYTTRTPVSDTLVIFEHQGNNLYQRINTSTLVYAGVGGFGDGDNDSLMEIEVTGDPFEYVLESPDRHSFPSRVAWRTQRVGAGLPWPQCLDLDQDGRREWALGADGSVVLFENAADDSYYLAANIRPPENAAAGKFCVGDFDCDGHLELAYGGQRHPFGRVCVFEATGRDNEYALRWEDTTVVMANWWTCTLGDLNGNGWPEFITVGRDSLLEGHMMVYEAYGDNQYHRILEAPCPYWDCPIVAADVDGDGVNEFAMAGGSATIYKWDGSSYTPIWVFPDSGVGSMNLYDLNGNGRAEIILALPDHTSIYEDTQGLGHTEHQVKLEFNSVKVRPNVSCIAVPIRFLYLPVGADVQLYSASGCLLRREQQVRKPTWTWDLRDQNGRQVPAGTYLAVIRSRNQTQQLKLCVVR